MSKNTSFALQHPTQHVLLALLPGTLISSLFLGRGILINLALTIASCLVYENLALKIQRQSSKVFSYDPGIVLTGSLLALSLPPSAAWWLCVTGGGIAILFGKHLLPKFGGISLNPAMLGLVVLLATCPAQMSNGHGSMLTDALSSATPLDAVRSGLRQQRTFSEITAALPHANDWTWISLAYLLGGIYLLSRGIIRWPVPTAVLCGLMLPALMFWAMDADRNASPLFHVLTGAAMLGAFFIATEPHTAPANLRERLIYGAGIGLLAFAIRAWGRYPDGFGFAVLLMNLCTPTMEKTPDSHGYKIAFAGLLLVIGLSLSTLLMSPYQQLWGRWSQPNADAPLNELLQAQPHDNAPASDIFEIRDPALFTKPAIVYRARQSGVATAAIFHVTTSEGYNGDIELLVAVDAAGKLIGIRVLQHQETRGFGDPAASQLSGATVTQTAVRKAAQRCQEYFLQHRNEILSPP